MAGIQFKHVQYPLSYLMDQIEMGAIGLPRSSVHSFGRLSRSGICSTRCTVDFPSGICFSGKTWSSQGPK